MSDNVIELVIRAIDEASSQIDGVGKSVGDLSLKLTGLEDIAKAVAGAFTFKAIIDEMTEAQFATAQLDQSFKNAQATVGISRDSLDEYNTSLQKTSTFSDSNIKSAESMLLAYKSLHGEAFQRALQDAADLATAWGESLPQAASTLGRAIENPDAAIQLLRRSHIALTDAETQDLKAMAALGDQAGATNLILGKIESTMGGSAAAAASTLGGAIDQVEHSFSNLFDLNTDSTSGAIGALQNLRDVVSDPQFIANVQQLIKTLADGLTGLIPIFSKVAEGWSSLFGLLDEVPDTWGELGKDISDSFKSAGLQNQIEDTQQEFDQAAKSAQDMGDKGSDAYKALTDRAAALLAKLQDLHAQQDALQNVSSGNDDLQPIKITSQYAAAGSTSQQTSPQIKEITDALDKQTQALALAAQGGIVTSQALELLAVKAQLAKLGITGLIPQTVLDHLAAFNAAARDAGVGALKTQLDQAAGSFQAQTADIAHADQAAQDYSAAIKLLSTGFADSLPPAQRLSAALAQVAAQHKASGDLAAQAAEAQADSVYTITQQITLTKLQTEAVNGSSIALAEYQELLKVGAKGVTELSDAQKQAIADQVHTDAGLSAEQQIKSINDETAVLQAQTAALNDNALAVKELQQLQSLSKDATPQQKQQVVTAVDNNDAAQGQHQLALLQQQLTLESNVGIQLKEQQALRQANTTAETALGQEIIKTVDALDKQQREQENIAALWDSLFQNVHSGIKGMLEAFINALEQIALKAIEDKAILASMAAINGTGGFWSTLVGGLGSLLGGGDAADIAATVGTGDFASGGLTAGGPTLVGEEGPEVLNLPAGTEVTNKREMDFRAGSGSGGDVNYAPVNNIVISAADADRTKAELFTFLAQQQAQQSADLQRKLRRNGYNLR